MGVQATGADAMEKSWRSGELLFPPAVSTIADGIGVRVPIREAVEDNPTAREQACGQVALLGTDRTKVLEMLDSLPKESRDPLVESLRQRGEEEGWLPAEATTWQFPELRRAIVALLDECLSG